MDKLTSRLFAHVQETTVQRMDDIHADLVCSRENIDDVNSRKGKHVRKTLGKCARQPANFGYLTVSQLHYTVHVVGASQKEYLVYSIPLDQGFESLVCLHLLHHSCDVCPVVVEYMRILGVSAEAEWIKVCKDAVTYVESVSLLGLICIPLLGVVLLTCSTT